VAQALSGAAGNVERFTTGVVLHGIGRLSCANLGETAVDRAMQMEGLKHYLSGRFREEA
jgi:hypothetical protein